MKKGQRRKIKTEKTIYWTRLTGQDRINIEGEVIMKLGGIPAGIMLGGLFEGIWKR